MKIYESILRNPNWWWEWSDYKKHIIP